MYTKEEVKIIHAISRFMLNNVLPNIKQDKFGRVNISDIEKEFVEQSKKQKYIFKSDI